MKDKKPLTIIDIEASLGIIKPLSSEVVFILNPYYWEKFKSWSKANQSDLVPKKGKK